jgi:hypothetical protein
VCGAFPGVAETRGMDAVVSVAEQGQRRRSATPQDGAGLALRQRRRGGYRRFPKHPGEAHL